MLTSSALPIRLGQGKVYRHKQTGIISRGTRLFSDKHNKRKEAWNGQSMRLVQGQFINARLTFSQNSGESLKQQCVLTGGGCRKQSSKIFELYRVVTCSWGTISFQHVNNKIFLFSDSPLEAYAGYLQEFND